MMRTLFNDGETCETCSGEGSYVYDTGYDYSYKSGTHKYLAECEDCNGRGVIYKEEDEDDES